MNSTSSPRHEPSNAATAPPVPRVTRGVLLALPPDSPCSALAAGCMSTLVDRPLVQHAIERMSGDGVEQLEIVGLKSDLELQRFVCNGDRWGCRVVWRGARHADDCDPLIEAAGEDRILLGDASTIPLHSLRDQRLEGGVAALVRGPGQLSFTGWAQLDAPALESIPRDSGRRDLREWIELLAEMEVQASHVLHGASLDQLLASQRLLQELEACRAGASCEGEATIRLIGRERSPGVRICRNVKIHRTARLTGPVFIGDNSRIGRGVCLGPNTVVGPDCIIDGHAQVSNSLICDRTYVGPWVEVQDCVVRQQEVVNVRLQARVAIDDPLVAGGV